MYVEVILPVPLADTYTYFVPPPLEAQIVSGTLVTVAFGKKHYSGIVASIHQTTKLDPKKIKPILSVEGNQPIVNEVQLSFWKWISDYYFCKLGEVFKAALPSGFKSESATPYTEKKETFISIHPNCSDFNETLSLLKRAKQQEKLFRFFIDYISNAKFAEISKKSLLEISETKENALSALIEKEILISYPKSISRLKEDFVETEPLHKLNKEQKEAYNNIQESFKEKNVCLLHGVTSSGKTEIYTHLIQDTLKQNKQVLYLVPEIALTSQLTDRLKQFFGEKVGIYHSSINNNERVEIWNNLLEGNGYQIILGVRSSVFLPFKNLGLVIIDEEHETSYKQQDPSPRYHARNAAIMLAKLHHALTVLGSATPSIESYHNSKTGKFGYVRLDKRYTGIELPNIIAVDIKELKRKKIMKSIFSPLLISKINDTLEQGEQVLLFQNRRGFAPAITCRICDWTPSCRFCDISLTYYKGANTLTCHYCGRAYSMPKQCPECESTELQSSGFGTEKVEEEIKKLFPNAVSERMDTDTTRKKNAIENIIKRFEKGETQILIGTQMLSKGLDFEHVNLVGILNAESLRSFPDFRADERAYQLISQVAGRAGRRKKQGEVILQTSDPDHPLIQQVLGQDYEGMYQSQAEERNLFRYPPFFRIIHINIKHKNEAVIAELADTFALFLRQELGDRIIGPDKPAVGRKQNLYLRRIILKAETNFSIEKLREIIFRTQQQVLSIKPSYRYAILQFDVDPS